MTSPLQPLLVNTTVGQAPPSPPSSPLLTRQSENRPPEPSPATTEPPKKRRKRNSDALASKSDAEVWNCSDSDILGACACSSVFVWKLTSFSESITSKWRSDHYWHYTPSLVRDESKKQITIVLKCRFNDPLHPSIDRLREEPGTFNTSNMATTSKTCIARDPSRAANAPSSSSSASVYTEATHRTLIALRCASSKRPFNQAEDTFYLQEVELLRPGTKVPSVDTVANDVQRLYCNLAGDVRDYFQRRGREIHTVVDGWTAPMGEQYLGAGLIWEDGGEMHHITLEFIRYVFIQFQSRRFSYLAA
ncbi:hypothetical protein FB45DRAFT_78756 [Roridomyces roridus]|uniref:Uncharacterized protein n=1 Tax=Roridomyces roridus TaxID=1738132 RepID=A0AAD7AYF2_9AGAR|nr:hypothetical protein FB45DRAFT_78756 [Roridomyces roridus]